MHTQSAHILLIKIAFYFFFFYPEGMPGSIIIQVGCFLVDIMKIPAGAGSVNLSRPTVAAPGRSPSPRSRRPRPGAGGEGGRMAMTGALKARRLPAGHGRRPTPSEQADSVPARRRSGPADRPGGGSAAVRSGLFKKPPCR